jgi:UDP-4-keto-D-QuiNAc 4-reductase
MTIILITGANGFLGSATVKRLAESGYRINCVVRQAPTQRLAGNVLVVGDVLSNSDWTGAFKNVDTVVHLAGRAHVLRESSTDPQAAFFNTNVVATARLARMAAEHGVRRFIFLSSVGVHGMNAETPLVENDPIRPWNLYAKSKWQAEEMLRSIAADVGLELVVIRPPLIYGEGVKGNFYKLLEYVDREIPLPLANASNRRSLAGLDNVVDLIACCVEHPRAAGESFLVADDEDVSTADLIRTLAAALGRRERLFPVPVAMARGVLKIIGKEEEANRLYSSLRINATKAKQLLGWIPRVALNDGLHRTAHWYRGYSRRVG